MRELPIGRIIVKVKNSQSKSKKVFKDKPRKCEKNLIKG